RLQLARRDRARLDQELAELGAATMAIEDRQELAARDNLLRDEDLAEQHVGRRLALQTQRVLDLGVRGEAFGDQQVAEPQDRRVTPRGAVVGGEGTAVDRDQTRRSDVSRQ